MSKEFLLAVEDTKNIDNSNDIKKLELLLSKIII
jgi:hypothetical protein